MLMKRKLKKLFNSDSTYYSGSNFSVDHDVKDDSTLHIYKKHQKDKKHNSNCLKKSDIDSFLNNRSILSSKVSHLDSNCINKHIDSENNLPSSSVNLTDNKVDETSDIYRQEHLVRGISPSALRKKSKRDNDVQSCLSKVKDCSAQIENCIDSFCSKEVVFDGSLDKKHKSKKDQSTNDLRYANSDQVLNNQTIQYLNSNNIEDHKEKKHKKVKQDRSERPLEKVVNNTANDISNNENFLDDPLSTVGSKKKHKVIFDNTEAKNDVNIAEFQNYFTSNLTVTEHRKKHKKRKYKDSNLTEGLENGNQKSDSCTILCLNSSVFGDSLMKKHKKKKEHILTTTAKHFTDYTDNKITNISEEQYVDATLRKTHKKHKHITNGIEVVQDVNIAEKNCQEFELPSGETSNTLSKKKHKKHKKKNDDKLTQDSCNIGLQIFENHDIPHLNESALSSHIKKKNRKDKETSSVSFGNFIDKTVSEFNDINKDQHLEVPISNNSQKKIYADLTDNSVNKITEISEEQYLDAILREKHKKHKHSSNGTEDIENVNVTENYQDFELPSNEMSVTLCKKKHKKHKKNKGDKSTQDLENKDNQIFENHDVSYLNEPVLSSHNKKKDKENSLVTFSNFIDKNDISKKKHLEVPISHNSQEKKHTDLTQHSVNKIADASEERYLDATLSIKHKKHKHSSNGRKAIQDANIAEENCQDFELQKVPDISLDGKRKHKKHKDDKSTLDSGNTDKQSFKNQNIPYLSEPILSSHIKKKDKENSLVTCNNFIDKTVIEVNDINEDHHLEDPISNNSLEKEHTVNKISDISVEQYLGAPSYAATLRKKHKKHKHTSNGTEAIQYTNIAEKKCQYFELASNEMSGTLCKKKHKKHKKNKDDKLTQDSEYTDNQISENHNILYMNEPVLSSIIKKKDKQKNLITLNNFMNKTVIEVTNSSDDQHLKFLNSNNSLKKKHKRHNDTEINSCDSSTAIRDIHTQISSYENSSKDKSAIDTLPTKKLKKNHASKIVNTASSFNDVNQNPSSNNDVYMNLHDSKTLKKKKRSKERKIIPMTDPVHDNYEVPYLDDSRSDRTHNKKHKKCKSNYSSVDKDLDQILSNCETQVPDYVVMKKHKNIKDNAKDSTSVNQTGHKVSNNSELPYSNNFSSTKQNKSANVIENGYDLNDMRNNCIINRDQISLCVSNNETSESDSSMHTNDSENIRKSKEPSKNSFEIKDNIPKESKNLKENKSADLDFTEDDVNFEIPRLHANESIKNLSEEEKNELISQGVNIKTGKFTHEEDTIILKNIENFLKTYDTLDISEVLGIGRLKKDFYFTKFLKAKHFYARLGKGLNDRTLISIYKRARRLIHPNKNNEKFQENEIRSLKFLHNVVNKKWTYIGDTLGRTEDKCLQAYRWHAKPISHGKWTKEEEQQLIAAIEKVTGCSDLSCDKLKGISWDEVATHVPTRNFSQCRMHWAFHLAWKPGALKHKWDKNCSKKLLTVLRYEWYVENASEIDWLKIYESFMNVAPSHIFLQKRWLTLRYQIKGFKTLSYRDTVDILCKKYNITHNEAHTTLS